VWTFKRIELMLRRHQPSARCRPSLAAGRQVRVRRALINPFSRAATGSPVPLETAVNQIEVLAGAISANFLSAVLSARGSSLMCFPQGSGVSAHLEKRPKQAKNEKNKYAWDLTRMVS
jgi:hypothetical protein